jgi:hypothetical protein
MRRIRIQGGVSMRKCERSLPAPLLCRAHPGDQDGCPWLPALRQLPGPNPLLRQTQSERRFAVSPDPSDSLKRPNTDDAEDPQTQGQRWNPTR